jgi:hypothetical protein
MADVERIMNVLPYKSVYQVDLEKAKLKIS